MSECKPLINGEQFVRTTVVGQSFMLHQIRKLIAMMLGRGLHTSTFRLNVSTFCGIS